MNTACAWTQPVGKTAAVPDKHTVEIETVSCLLCGADNFETVIIASDPTTDIGGHFRVVRCCHCDLVFTNPRPTTQSIGQFYPDDYQPHASRKWNNGLSARLSRQLEKAVLAEQYGYPTPASGIRTTCLSKLGQWRIRRNRQRQSWIPFREPGRLLDFGCGAGQFLQEMREFGWSVRGIDISESVARQVEECTGITVHVGTLPHADLKGESFDAVTMWNSLEHVHQPRETVRSAGELLRPGGILVIGVPNFASWGFRTFGQDWESLDLPRHLAHFTPETLGELLRREGYEILSCQQIARVGWLRHSVRRTRTSGRGSRWMDLLKWKPIGLRVAHWSERTAQADFIRVIAEKR